MVTRGGKPSIDEVTRKGTAVLIVVARSRGRVEASQCPHSRSWDEVEERLGQIRDQYQSMEPMAAGMLHLVAVLRFDARFERLARWVSHTSLIVNDSVRCVLATVPPTAAAFAKAAAEEPNLLRRPILVNGKRVIVGFDQAAYAKLSQ